MINFATKYSDKIATAFTHDSFVIGKTNNDYSFVGAKTIQVVTPVTQPMGDYRRSGSNRYGEPAEMQDTIQEMTMTQDKAAPITIDKGNNSEQMMLKNAGKMLSLQIKERVVPMMDKYCLKVFATKAGKVAGLAAAPTKATIIELIASAATAFDNALIPDEGRYLYVASSVYNLIRLAPEFLNIDALGKKILEKGVVGGVLGFDMVKVPDSFIPANCYFIATHKDSVLAPAKIKDGKIHQDPPGISGHLLELRNVYDAFVLGARADGVYAAVAAASVVATPTITITTNSATIASTTGSAKIVYTLDGSDPRYSKSAQVYGAPVDVPAGATVRAYAEKADMYPSAVADKKNA